MEHPAVSSLIPDALRRVTGALPNGGESRPGQVTMAKAVERAISERRHVIVQAGTGTGKSLAYLVPAVLLGVKTVVATATKALQDQLANKDLPLVAAHLGTDVDFSVLKGRSNYLCLQKAREVAGGLSRRSTRRQMGSAWPPGSRSRLCSVAPTPEDSVRNRARRGRRSGKCVPS